MEGVFMVDQISKFNSSIFASDDSEAIEEYSHILFETIKDAITQSNINSLSKELKKITDLFERVSNLLNIQETNNRKCFYFGYIIALSTIGESLADAGLEESQVTEILSNYSLLLPILDIIAKKDTISGVELKKATGLKSNNLSNFMHRIKQFELISIHKVGTTNYYSLTKKGRRFIEYSSRTDNSSITESQAIKHLLCQVFDELSTQLLLGRPSAIPVLQTINSDKNIQIKVDSLLKYKIESTFSSRDYYLRKKFETIADVAKEEESLADYTDWDDQYLSIKEHELVVFSEISYFD